MDESATTLRVAHRLKELCEALQNLRAIDELYHPDAVSVEAVPDPADPGSRETRGRDAIRAKNERWLGANELHERTIDGPYPHADDRFAFHIAYELTAREGPLAGCCMLFREVGVYTVRGGRIAREEYYYYAMPE